MDGAKYAIKGQIFKNLPFSRTCKKQRRPGYDVHQPSTKTVKFTLTFVENWFSTSKHNFGLAHFLVNTVMYLI